MLRDLPTSDIVRRVDARAVNPDTVAGLTDSIGAVGLINPIRVRQTGDRWEVIAGVHRLEACKALGLVEITCDVVEDDDLRAELAMIDENLCRAELTPTDRARQTARRKAIYEELFPETVNGVNQHSSLRQVGEPSAERFTSDTAKATGHSERTVQRDAERGEKVIDEVMDLIRGTALDTGAYLDKIKKLPPNEQVHAAKRDLAFRRQMDRDKIATIRRSKVDGDVKARAANAIAEWIAEHSTGEDYDFLKSNLYAAGASNIAHELTNITGQSIMDRGAA